MFLIVPSYISHIIHVYAFQIRREIYIRSPHSRNDSACSQYHELVSSACSQYHELVSSACTQYHELVSSACSQYHELVSSACSQYHELASSACTTSMPHRPCIIFKRMLKFCFVLFLFLLGASIGFSAILNTDVECIRALDQDAF